MRQNSELFDVWIWGARDIPWNFAKFLCNDKGKVVSYHSPKTEPLELVENIKMILETLWLKLEMIRANKSEFEILNGGISNDLNILDSYLEQL